MLYMCKVISIMNLLVLWIFGKIISFQTSQILAHGSCIVSCRQKKKMTVLYFKKGKYKALNSVY